MMRDILFRGKRIDNGEWVEGSFLRDGEAHRLARQKEAPFSDCYIVPKTERDNVRSYLTQGILLGTIAYHVNPETVGQYTGLNDKNGKKIFEGDIVEGREYTEDDGFGVVAWYDGAFEVGNGQWCGTFHENYNGYEFEIIGNIHDNPELLGGAN